jgi:flagellar basal body-associated protein FliL
MNKKGSRKEEIVIEINGFVALVVAIALVLLTAATVLLFVFKPWDKRGDDEDDSKKSTEAVTTLDSTPAGSNTTPLFPTNETRTSYHIMIRSA